MKILITGGTGSLGKEICNILSSRGISVLVLAREKRRLPYESCWGDISNLEVVKGAVKNCDRVIHAAVAKRTDTSEEIVNTNIIGSKNVLLACEEFEKPVKMISSSEALPDPVSKMYGYSKYIMEELTKEFSQRCEASYIRLPTILGSTESLVQRWLLRKKVELYIFDGHSKKKFFVTLKEAAIACCEESQKEYIEASVMDISDLAKIISNHLHTQIIPVNRKGEYYEWLGEGYCSKDMPPIGIEELKKIVEETCGIREYILPW